MPVNVIRNDQVENIIGTAGDDHLIHHRDPEITNVHSSIGMSGGSGNDTLEASLPYAGQVHMWGGRGDDTFILDMTNFTHHQGHHAYGGLGSDKFNFVNIAQNQFVVTGRIDDYDHSEDEIWIEGVKIELEDLPAMVTLPDGSEVEVRIIQYEQVGIQGQGLGPQQVLVIDNSIFYVLEGARELQNLDTPASGEERHFLTLEDVDRMRLEPSTKFVDPQNFVPAEFYQHRDDLREVTDSRGPVSAPSDRPMHYFGGKSTENDVTGNGWRSSQEISGSDRGDVINGNTGNDTIFGGSGDDLIAGGVDNDLIYGGAGNDMIWGGSGEDLLYGEDGDDFLDGGFGNDTLHGGAGSDTLVGGRGDDTLTGSGEDREEGDVNRFHFADGDGHDVITDFAAKFDILSFQDDVDPSTITIFESADGDTVIHYGDGNTVTLQGVPLSEFQEQAEARMEEDDPILIITPDPELELLRELQLSLGTISIEDAPSIKIDGVDYGAIAFTSEGAGGYNYGPPPQAQQPDDEGDDADSLPTTPPPGQGGGGNTPPDDEEDEEEDENEKGGDGSCFVATAAYRDPFHPDVKFLRDFRDQWLCNRGWGRAFIRFYWRYGPHMARPVRSSGLLSFLAKRFIGGIVTLLRLLWK